MKGLENITAEMAEDLIELVNSLQKIPKTAKVAYNVFNKTTGKWNKKEFNYVPLDNILEKIKENKNFAFLQPIGFDEELGKFGVRCILIHKTGKSLMSNLYEIPIKEDSKIQDEGAEITYRKRYAAGAFLGVATEEDTDGNDPEAEQIPKGQIKGVTLKAKGNTEKQILDLMTKMKSLVIDTNSDMEEILKWYKVKSNADMTLEQLQDCVKNLELKQQKMTMLKESGQEVE